MIIFLYGEDDWRRNERKNLIIKEFKKKNPSLGVQFFNMEEDSVESILVFISQPSLFGGKKLAVLENMDLKENKKFLQTLIGSESNILISSENKPTKETKFLLEEPVIKEEFIFLKSADWTSFLNKKLKEEGVVFAPDALKFFASVYEKNTWGALTEIEKVSSLGKKEISLKDLASMDMETSPDFWTTLQRLKGRTLKERMWALQILSLKNEPAGKTFNILSSFWPEKSAVLADFDSKAKSGKLEYDEIILDLVLS